MQHYPRIWFTSRQQQGRGESPHQRLSTPLGLDCLALVPTWLQSDVRSIFLFALQQECPSTLQPLLAPFASFLPLFMCVGVWRQSFFREGFAMYKVLKVSVVLWAWGCWAWVAYSHQWFWLAISVIPYLLFNSFGHYLDKEKE